MRENLVNPIMRYLQNKSVQVVLLFALVLIVTSIVFPVRTFAPYLNRAMVASTPLLLGTLGEIYAERSGVLNLGVEGMMATGAATAVIGAFWAHSAWVGIAVGALSGASLALIFAVIAIFLEANQVVTGLGLFILGLGVSGVVGSPYVGLTLPYALSKVPIPVLSEIPVLGPLFFKHTPLVYLALVLVPILWFILYKTRIGLIVRSTGENPSAVDSSGVNVYKVRYLCVIFGGLLAGLAGSYLSIAWTPGWVEGMSAGRGWIVIALTIFALWDPLYALPGSLLFGGLFSLKYSLQGCGVSPRIISMFPFIAALIGIVLVLRYSERLGAPSALMEPYTRE